MQLFYRTGGTLNFVWRPVFDGAWKEAALLKAGYPAIWAAVAPTAFEPTGMLVPSYMTGTERSLRKGLQVIKDYAEAYKPKSMADANATLVLIKMVAEETLDGSDTYQPAMPLPQPAA